MKLDHAQFQSLSRCEALGIAKQVQDGCNRLWIEGQEFGFKMGLEEAYEHINAKLAKLGIPHKFTYDLVESK